MSREERRAYQRLTKKQDPYALPANSATRARIQRQERIKARRAATSAATPEGGLSRRFLYWAIGGAIGAALISFSLAWPSGMPFAGYVGVGVGVAWIALAFAVRALVGRAAPRR